MDVQPDHPTATEQNCMEIALAKGTPAADRIKKQSEGITANISESFYHAKLDAVYINKVIEKVLWHQRLKHPCDKYLYKASKAIKDIPTFKLI